MLLGHENIVYCAEFSPEKNGRRIVSCGHDGQLIIWDAVVGKQHIHIYIYMLARFIS